MSDDRRPSPDELLARAREEADRARRGRLKLFFGAAPGVGKTYAMLEAAQARRRRGDDVVIGWLETHGRADTEAVAHGLERVPPRVVAHRGLSLRELDLDAVKARRPALVLVDELAHTNAPGSRHARRFQDVEELLAAGIDVFSTLNVQHVESLRDVVARITGVTVRETVPDGIVERADELELVDLPPEELQRRLEEGKVYVPDQARRALAGFFQRGNLIALRELALRRTAEHVDDQGAAWRRSEGGGRPWGARERVLVAVSAAPQSADVVRAAARLAASLKAPWIALSVETPAVDALGADDRARIAAHLALAEGLGAEPLVVRGDRAGEEIVAVARARDVTRIVVGKPAPRGWWARRRPTLVDWLVLRSGPIDVHVTSGTPDERPAPAARAPTARPPARGLAVALGAIAVATLVNVAAGPWLTLGDQSMVYLLGVLGVASRLSRRDALVTAAGSVLALNFFFVPPYYTFAVSDARHLATFLVLLVTGVVVSGFAARVRAQAQAARERERRTAGLYALSRALSAAGDPRAIAEIAVRQVAEDVGAAALVVRAGGGGAPQPLAGALDGAADAERERAVAQWVLDNGRPAGASTDTLPGAEGWYLPLAAGGRVHGVLGVRLAGRAAPLAASARQALETVAALTAAALERASLTEAAERARVAVETERTRSTLLAAVSHDLRTPLASITGAAGALLSSGPALDDDRRRALVTSIRDEGERLGRLVTDLLDLTRLEAGGFVVLKEWYPLEELVVAALARVRPRLVGREVKLALPSEVLLVSVDGVLIEQVVTNLLENAAKHTPAGTPVEVRVALEPSDVVLEVLDRGPGIPAGEERRVFERFHRLPSASDVEGSGLGLALCQAIVRAHGGTIGAEPRPGGGAVFRVRLPRGDAPPLPPEEPEAPSRPADEPDAPRERPGLAYPGPGSAS